MGEKDLPDIYNPWSIINYLDKGKIGTYWANTSANSLVGKLIRESGFGRYDVMLEPVNREDSAMILEFKVHDPEDEGTLEDTVQAALEQIEEKKYEQRMVDRGIGRERIRKYGFAFEGKKGADRRHIRSMAAM